MIDRQQLVEELKLREQIRRAIKIIREGYRGEYGR